MNESYHIGNRMATVLFKTLYSSGDAPSPKGESDAFVASVHRRPRVGTIRGRIGDGSGIFGGTGGCGQCFLA